tara:strand:- start:245 stop:427 length:183 start_codon:yes stop_codon:yes gene_type:complete
LGLKFTGDPDWFYNLTPTQRINVLAFSRIENAPPKTKSKGGKLNKQVKATESGRDFWMGD